MIFVDLQNAYSTLNDGLFNGSLPRVRFEGLHDRNAVFCFLGSNVIGIGKNFLLASRVDVLDHLLHQMIYLSHANNGVKEWESPEYHESMFLPEALRCGLNVVRDSRRGWVISTSKELFSSGNGNIAMATRQSTQQRDRIYRDADFSVENLLRLQQQLGSSQQPQTECVAC
jgi:hypothetical protein